MRVLFFGSSVFSVPFLTAIHNSVHCVKLVITKPASKTGRGRKIIPNPVKSEALRLGIKFYELNAFNDDFYKQIEDLEFDILVVVSFGKIMPGKLIDMVKNKTLNLHPSILPKYRGPSPITTALLNGDKITGISLTRINKTVDTGDIMYMRTIPVLRSDNSSSLEYKIIKTGTGMLTEFLDMYEKGQVNSSPQPSTGVSYTRIFSKKDMEIDWNKNSVNIINKIRAFGPVPGCTTSFKGRILKILKAEIIKSNPVNTDNTPKSGEVVKADKDGLLVMCGKPENATIYHVQDFLSLITVKPQDKNSMNYLDFINGYRIKPGDFFE